MDTTRYFLGVLLVVSVPPAVVFWLLIHPLVGFWRRIGPVATFMIVGTLCVFLAVILYQFRVWLLGDDMGTNWILILIGTVLYAASAWITVLTRRRLDLGTFVGVPELSKGDSGGVLLQEGIYGVVRHPRYLSVIIGIAGFSMFVNHFGAYVLVFVSFLALWLVAIIEERELSIRFGATYEGYRSRVPALFPRISKSPNHHGQ